MNASLLVVPAGILAVAGAVHAGSLHGGTGAIRQGGTIARSTPGWIGSVARISRTPAGTIVDLRDGSAIRAIRVSGLSVETANGSSLPIAGIRTGDSIARSAHTLRDLSLRTTTLKGIIAVAGLEAGDPLIVQLTPTHSMLADVTSAARYLDPSGQTASTTELEDADVVRITGTYDAQLDEMTSVTAITRVGPYRHAGSAMGVSHG